MDNPRPSKRAKTGGHDEPGLFGLTRTGPYTLVIVGAGATAIWVAKTFLKNHQQGNVLLISSPIDQNAPILSDKMATGRTFFSAAEIGTQFDDLKDGYQLHKEEKATNSINSHHYIEVPIYHSLSSRKGREKMKNLGYTLVEESWSASILPKGNTLYHQADKFKLLLHPDYFSDERKLLGQSFSSRLTIQTGHVLFVKPGSPILVVWEDGAGCGYGSLASHVILACGMGYFDVAKNSGLKFRKLEGAEKNLGESIPEVHPAKVIGVPVASLDGKAIPPCFIQVDCAQETFNLYIRSNEDILLWFNSKTKDVKASPAVFKGYLQKKFEGMKGAQAQNVLACTPGRYVVWETTIMFGLLVAVEFGELLWHQ